jgi:hypothetical protein
MTIWYDLNKKGTLIFGMARSGTHHATAIASSELIKAKIDYSLLPEILLFNPYVANSADWDILANGHEEVARRFCRPVTGYTLASVPSQAGSIFLPNVYDSFHTIKIIRKELWAHFMSLTLFRAASTTPGCVANSVVDLDTLIKHISFPIEVDIAKVFEFIIAKTMTISMTSDETVYYEDIQNDMSTAKKSTMVAHPSEIFANYKRIDAIFQNLKDIHGW